MIDQRLPTICIALLATAASALEDYEQAPIRYSDTKPNDVVSRLQARLDSRELKIEGTEKDAVRAILRELRIPEASQLLVFSKTSVQRVRISPQTPRAIYFNDECYVGWVPGGLVEIAAIDPQLGPVFYTFDPMERSSQQPQRFRRDPNCLSCHAGNFTRDIPGVFARSVFAEATGSPIFSAGSELVDHTTPFEQRWGGWYVTGRHGKARHRGNAFAHESDKDVALDTERGANLEDLSRFIDPSIYPAATSDIAAFMVFEHQLAVHQALTKANHECRRMLAYQHGMQEAFKEPFTDEPSYDSVKSVFNNAAQSVLDALLYKDEAKMPESGVQGSPAFVEAFTASARKSSSGQSLRDLDLRTRIARYRCSFLIDSEHFRQLPKPLLDQILERLGRLLSAAEPEARYAYLPAEERQIVAQILCDTAPELTAHWPGQPSAR
jgi:hypothetical protein